jgi:hypothetical protein
MGTSGSQDMHWPVLSSHPLGVNNITELLVNCATILILPCLCLHVSLPPQVFLIYGRNWLITKAVSGINRNIEFLLDEKLERKVCEV